MKAIQILSMMFLLGFLSACDKDDSMEPSNAIKMTDLEGSWIATSVVHTNNANAAQTLDLVALGAELRITILAGGGARTWIDFGSFQDEWDSQLSISGDLVTSTPVESTRPVNVFKTEFIGDAIMLTNVNDSLDFTLSSMPPVSSTSVSLFIRQ